MEVWEYVLWKYGSMHYGNMEYVLWEYGVCIMGIWSMHYGNMEYALWEHGDVGVCIIGICGYGVCIMGIWSFVVCSMRITLVIRVGRFTNAPSSVVLKDCILVQLYIRH